MVRFKNRYFLIELTRNNNNNTSEITQKDLYTEIIDSIKLNYGELGASKL